MRIVVLPGIDQKTEKWANNLVQELALADAVATVQRYGHWDSQGDGCLRLEHELEQVRGMEADLLIGKSLGVVIGLLACQRGLLQPAKAVFIGTPVTAFTEKGLDLTQLADGLNIPALYIQQKDDVVGTSAVLCQRVGKAPQATLVEVPGNNHQYKDVKLVARQIRKWLGLR